MSEPMVTNNNTPAPTSSSNNAPAPTSSSQTGATPGLPSGDLGNLGASIAAVAGALALVAQITGEQSEETNETTSAMQQAELVVYQDEQEQAEDNLQQQEQDDQKKGFFGKIASHEKLVIEVTVIAGALVAGQYEIVGAVVATMVLSHFAGQMSQGIADALLAIDPNMSPQVAKMIGDGLTVVIIAAGSVAGGNVAGIAGAAAGAAAAGAAAAAEVGTVAVEVATDATEAGVTAGEAAQAGSEAGAKAGEAGSKAGEAGSKAEEAGSKAEEAEEAGAGAAGATEGATEIESAGQSAIERSENEIMTEADKKAEKSTFNQIKEILNTINPFNKSATANKIMLGTAQAWNATGGTNDALALSGNDSMKMKIIANGITDILTMAMSAGSVGGMMSMSEGGASLFGANSGNIIKALQVVGVASTLALMTGEIGSAVYSGKIANETEKYGEIQASLQRAQFNLELLTQDGQMTSQNLNKILDECLSDINALFNTEANAINSMQQMYA